MDLFARRDDFSADPFDAVLATARGIGFSIPDPQRDCYDIERASHITNLVQLMEMGNQVPDLKSALFALEQNRLLNGFLDTRELRRYTQGLQLATEALQSFEEQKAVLVEKLTRDDTETGIPVESDDQEAFTQIIQAIAQDKFKLLEYTTEIRQCIQSHESPVCWKPQLESLNRAVEQFDIVEKQMYLRMKLIEKYTRTLEKTEMDDEERRSGESEDSDSIIEEI